MTGSSPRDGAATSSPLREATRELGSVVTAVDGFWLWCLIATPSALLAGPLHARLARPAR